MNHVTSITLKLVFWYLFPIISFFAAKVVTSILSLRKRYAIKAQQQLHRLPDVPEKKVLHDIANYILERDY